jgi:hypothetical protein
VGEKEGRSPQLLYALAHQESVGRIGKHSKNIMIAHVRQGDPDFLHAAPDTFACAAFCKESRMKFASATKIDRKSRGNVGHPSGLLLGKPCYAQDNILLRVGDDA